MLKCEDFAYWYGMKAWSEAMEKLSCDSVLYDVPPEGGWDKWWDDVNNKQAEYDRMRSDNDPH